MQDITLLDEKSGSQGVFTVHTGVSFEIKLGHIIKDQALGNLVNP
jgi:hypothetical protein